MMTHVALVPYEVTVSSDTLTSVAAALQQQVASHFGPLWGVSASVSPFTDWNSVPADYWRIALVDELDSGAPGVHRASNGKPYALVSTHGQWSVVASHECLEMLADPTGARTKSGLSPRDPERNVDFLIEVCDPVGGVPSGYTIDGVQVSNFCTLDFYGGTGAPGERWAFGVQPAGPRQLLKGGYFAWHDPVTGDWWRRDWFGTDLTDNNLGPITPSASFLRGEIDGRVRGPRRAARRAELGRKHLVIQQDRAAVASARALARDVRQTLERFAPQAARRKNKKEKR